MKTICTHIIFLLLLNITASAQLKKNRNDSTTVTIQLNNSHNRNAPVDSVVVILDKHNLTGAGTIKQLFYPVNNKIVIPNVPEGKYYIDVFCLGIYQQTFSEISYVYDKRRSKNKFRFNLRTAERYEPSAVLIPMEKIDPLRLAVLRRQNNKP